MYCAAIGTAGHNALLVFTHNYALLTLYTTRVFMFIKRRTFDDVTEALETRAGDYFRHGLHACHSCGFSYN